MPMCQLPFSSFAAVNQGYSQGLVLGWQSASFDMGVFDDHEDHHVS